jgi:DeoR/GlpR family transcriptional regulator of sugar metabolism
MYKLERKNEILKILSLEKSVSVTSLAEKLYTSLSSIRRDLTVLERQGIIKRSYGRAELTEESSVILPFTVRAHSNIPSKKEIAKKALSLVNSGDIIFLDQSSSAYFVALELMSRNDITVVTNNIEIISLLSNSGIEVISSGGRLSKNNRNCLVGEDAGRIFTEICADLLFFSAKALTDSGEIYDMQRDEILLRRKMLGNAKKSVFLCESAKIGRSAPFLQCSLSELSYLITEKEPESIGQFDIEVL